MTARSLPRPLCTRCLRIPFYCGRLRYKGERLPGRARAAHIGRALRAVQERLRGQPQRQQGRKKRVFALRGLHVLRGVRLPDHGGNPQGPRLLPLHPWQGRVLSERLHPRRGPETEIEELLSRIEIGLRSWRHSCGLREAPRREGLRARARALSSSKRGRSDQRPRRTSCSTPTSMVRCRSRSTSERADGLAASRRALELRISEARTRELEPIEQVRDLALVAASARVRFQDAADEQKREVALRRYFVTSPCRRAT